MGYRILATLILLACGLSAALAAPVDAASLMRRARQHMAAWEFDSALSCYRPVADSYRPDMSPAQRQRTLEAIYGCCNANIYKGNYMAAYEDILLAGDVLERDTSLNDAPMHLHMCSLYIVLASQTGKPDFMDHVAEHGSRAFRRALLKGDRETVTRAFGNLTKVLVIKDTGFSIDADETLMRDFARRHPGWDAQMSLNDLGYWRAYKANDYAGAARWAMASLRAMPDNSSCLRARAVALKDLALAYTHLGRLAEADSLLQQTMTLSYSTHNPDIRLAILNIYRSIIGPRGYLSPTRLDALTRHQMELKDSLASYLIVDNMVQLEYLRDRRELNKQILRAEYRSRLMTYGCIALAVVVLGIVAFLLIVRRKNRKLFQRAMLLIDRMRSQYSMRPAAHAHPAPGAPRQKTVRYEGSNLSDDDKQAIAQAVDRVMATDAIYSSDLTLGSFAAICGYHAKAVSQVINEMHGCNFSSFVNRARIVEVCRRLDMPEYADLSVEGIAESAGFNSRAAFANNFRRFTGLGIREYRKAVEESKKHPGNA